MWPFPDRRPLGVRGEAAAARYLKRHGWKILERNIHLGRFELDLIARRGDTVAFIEVKTRRDDGLAPPDVNVTAAKRRRILAAAHQYIERHFDPDTWYQFDIVSVVMPESGPPQIDHIENAFEDN